MAPSCEDFSEIKGIERVFGYFQQSKGDAKSVILIPYLDSLSEYRIEGFF